ncbi:MAG: hypothetical protein AAF547_03030 [Actinomycetota bacterium]
MRRQRPRLRATASLGAAMVVAAILTLLPFGPAAAEAPSTVAQGVEDDGVYIGFQRRDIDEEALVAAVEDARFDGLRLVAVAPRDPQPSAKAFARRVQEETDADAALIFAPDGRLETYVIDDLASARIRATEAARAFSDPARAVEAFATELTSTREPETPEIVRQLMNALVLMALVIGVVVAIEQIVLRFRRSRQARSRSDRDLPVG